MRTEVCQTLTTGVMTNVTSQTSALSTPVLIRIYSWLSTFLANIPYPG